MKEEEETPRIIQTEPGTDESPLKGVSEAPLLSLEEAIQRAQEGDKELQETNMASPLSEALSFASKKLQNSSLIMGLSLQQAAAIHLCTLETPLFPILNRRLCQRSKDGLKPFLPFMKLLLSAMYLLPTVPATFYRRVRKSFGKEMRIAKDTTLVWWSFTELSSATENLKEGGKGTKERETFALQSTSGVYIKEFSAPGEGRKEILLPPGTCFAVEGVLDQGEGTLVYQLQESCLPGLLDYSRPARGSIPQRNPNFRGREKQLEEMRESLKNDPKEGFSQLVLAAGGGMGKSSLALEYLHRHHMDHVLARWIPSEKDAEEELKELGISLGILQQSTSKEEAARKVVAHLETLLSGWLLIYDNVESAEGIKGLIPDPNNSAKGHVIVTTRDHHFSRGDPFSRVISLSSLSLAEGTDLLLHCAQRAKESIEASDLEAVEGICHELGNLPLALAQAGSFTLEAGFSFAEYLELLGRERRDLMESQGHPSDYPYSIVTTWKVSVDKIRKESPESVPILLRSLLVHAEDIPPGLLGREGEKEIGKLRWMKLVKPLVRFSLLSETKPGYYSIHRLTQASLRDELVESNQEEKKRLVKEVGLSLEREWSFDESHPSTWTRSRELVPHLEAFLSHAEGDQKVPRLCYALGYYQVYLDVNLVKAGELMERCLEVSKELHGEADHPETAMALFGIGLVCERRGDLSKAVSNYTRALDMRKKIYPKEHPDLVRSLNNLGNAYNQQENLPMAISYYTRSLKMAKRLFGDEHPDIARALNNLGMAYDAQDNLSKAIECYTLSLEMRRRIYGEEHPHVATVLNNLGLAYESQGEFSKALDSYNRSLTMYLSIYGNEHPDVAMTLNNLGAASGSLGNHSKALEYYAQSLLIYQRIYGETHPCTRKVAENLEAEREGETSKSPQYEESKKGSEPIVRRKGQNEERAKGKDKCVVC